MVLDELWQEFKELQKKLGEIVEDTASKDELLKEIDKHYDKLIAEGDRLMEIRQHELE